MGTCLFSCNHFHPGVYACVYVCTPPRPKVTSGVILASNDSADAFQFCFMVLAVDVIGRCGPSNEMRCQSQPKKTKVRLY